MCIYAICNVFMYVYFRDIFMFSMCKDRIWMYVCNMYVIYTHIADVCVCMSIWKYCSLYGPI